MMFEFNCRPKITKIISGGQTGADEAGLIFARKNGISTGGVAPRGYKTEKGSNFELRDVYGLLEHASDKYPPRTEDNVKNSDMTVIFSIGGSVGSELTKRLCIKHTKPYMYIECSKKLNTDEIITTFWKTIEKCNKNEIVLNIARK